MHLLLAALIVSGQLLDFERGFVVLSDGDAFRTAANVRVEGAPQAGRYARLTFDDSGVVVRIEAANRPLTASPPAAAHRFAVALSPETANPDLSPLRAGPCGKTRAGRVVGITVTVEVPPQTPTLDAVYMTSDQSGWDPQAYRLDRIDALHYRTTLQASSGTVMRVLFDRGSMQSVQLAQNGLDQTPYVLCVADEDVQAFSRIVYRWADLP